MERPDDFHIRVNFVAAIKEIDLCCIWKMLQIDFIMKKIQFARVSRMIKKLVVVNRTLVEDLGCDASDRHCLGCVDCERPFVLFRNIDRFASDYRNVDLTAWTMKRAVHGAVFQNDMVTSAALDDDVRNAPYHGLFYFRQPMTWLNGI